VCVCVCVYKTRDYVFTHFIYMSSSVELMIFSVSNNATWKHILFTNSVDVLISSSDYRMPYVQSVALFRAPFAAYTECS
jgi:hypothetical protein